MEYTDSYAEQLEEILLHETGVLSSLHVCQKRMYESVLIRDWVVFQKETEVSGTITDSFLKLEEKRIEVARGILPDAEGSTDFYRITAEIEEPLRSRINSLFRDVKRLLLLSKTENDVLNTYVSNARTLVSGLIETALPARRNRIYTKHGSLASKNVESMVLNRSF